MTKQALCISPLMHVRLVEVQRTTQNTNSYYRQWKDSQLSLNQCQWTVRMTSSLHTPLEAVTSQDALCTVRQAIFFMLLLLTRYVIFLHC